jgi:hypothetical protein
MMHLKLSGGLVFLIWLQSEALAFRPTVSITTKTQRGSALFACQDDRTRRSFMRDAAAVSFGLITAQRLPLNIASASGGATAGGPYLLSAKQRYNERVIAGMKSFLSLSSALDSGDLATASSFFSNEDVGSWKDASAAGFLLANAFRRNSSAAPDSLPAVKVCPFCSVASGLSITFCLRILCCNFVNFDFRNGKHSLLKLKLWERP